MKVNNKNINIYDHTNNQDFKIPQDNQTQIILCSHCKRTATNGIRCIGACVSDSEY